LPFTNRVARRSPRRSPIHPLLIASALLLLVSTGLSAQRAGTLVSLKALPRPEPIGLDRYVRDPEKLVALGKALFWDVQAGSDGRTACASCHFHAGADHRRQNQLASPHDAVAVLRPNQTLTIDDFPFRKREDPFDHRSALVRDSRLVAGSAGIVRRRFLDIEEGGAAEVGIDDGTPTPFAIDGVKVRQVTARNSPSVVNAVFNVRNFWDGRASRAFTGATPFGDSDTELNAMVASPAGLEPERVRIENSSLASQAVEPVLNEVEMSYSGRSWAMLGRKLLSLPPLARQQVAPDDSVLGRMASRLGPGLETRVTYASLIRAAFQPAYWRSSRVVDANGRVLEGVASPQGADEFSQIEYNFALFWGLAIQAYESTLVSDDSPFDRFMDGDTAALSALEQAGLSAFRSTRSQCSVCHQGAEFTSAAFSFVAQAGFDETNLGAFGFFRTGVSEASDDIGAAARDGFGLPLFPAVAARATEGAFKTPGLRNVALTGPYFHNGGMATLTEAMEFYARQGDFPGTPNIFPLMRRIQLNEDDRTALVAFLEALTDDRVRFERAPFDHPALCVATGYDETPSGALPRAESVPGSDAIAADRWALIPAAGREGNSVPLQTFEELLRGIGDDGSRAHTLNAPCRP